MVCSYTVFEVLGIQFVDLIKRRVLSLVAEITITIISKAQLLKKPSALYKKHDGGWGVGGRDGWVGG